MKWLFVLALAACSKDSSRTPAPLVSKSHELADKACACHDAACLAPLQTAWEDLTKQPAELTSEDVDALAQETQRFEKCVKSTH